jgi:septum formation protein
VALGGRRHQVITAIAVRRGARILTRENVSAVKMKRLSDEELNAYLASGEWQGKAGAYGIQGLAGAFLPWISGSFSGIMGLPIAETAALLGAIGYPVWRQG